MYNPIATYRIQFHKDFTFADFERHIDYFIGLGVKTIYASPIFTSVPGSTHGYDALDPLTINPEIGTLEQLRTITKRLRAAGIGWLQDIVPNHMAYDTRNPWLRDVLEKGRHSAYAGFFDVTWNDSVAAGHIMAPFLGKSLEEAVRDGELKLLFEEGRFSLDYYGSHYPLRLRSYKALLEGAGTDALEQWCLQADDVLAIEDAAQHSNGFEELLGQLAGLAKNDAVHAVIDQRVAALNDDKEALLAVANDQVYRLCHWQESDGRMNYRRFFTVNGLICLNMQDGHVFRTFHQLIKQLVDEEVFQGVRVDHVDGLYDPSAYLEQLRDLLGPECYIVVEKILELHETLPQRWPIEGTTGYDFLAQVNQVLTDPQSESAFTRYYYGLVPDHRSVAQQVRDKKAHMLYRHMGGELENLYQLLMQLLQPEDYAQMRTEDLKTAIAELLIHMPVYRYYGNALPLQQEEATLLHAAFEQARVSRPDLSPALGLLEHTLLHPERDAGRAARILHLYKRLMQQSGPLMAKGVEDTLMYTFFRFIGHNEVGDAPAQFGWTAAEWHRALRERKAEWPLALNATSTHDTKRGEDVRARLQALSALPEQWLEFAKSWMDTYRAEAPDVNDAYLLLQTLVAAQPFDEEADFGDRLEAYMEKALRESKRRSDWAHPDASYEDAAKSLAKSLAGGSNPFGEKARLLQERINEFGIVHSLAQLLLKFTAPGVPDIYQGCEGWDLSLVDPDNRRPVDYDLRAKWLSELTGSKPRPDTLWRDRRDGRIKFWLTRRLLQLRQSASELFTRGNYIPVEVEGPLKRHVLAFARHLDGKAVITAVPLHSAGLADTFDTIDWQDTHLLLPDGFGSDWQLLTGSPLKSSRKLLVADLFRELPFALLEGSAQQTNARGSGLLLHITSLPSPYGIGDLGPEAYRFADFLSASKQRYWQLLPVNPTEAGQGHSPYSSHSSNAGSRLLISPEGLRDAGWLQPEDLAAAVGDNEATTDYAAAEILKEPLLAKAWQRFSELPADQEAFAAYGVAQRSWLDDFARYSVLKRRNGGKPWYEWPDAQKFRSPETLKQLDSEEANALQQVRWEQWVFEQQWHALKAYCNERGLQLLGDLPFYVSYDSADVWAHRDLFLLDDAGNRLGVAGVPPDAFSADGQLWGMPVFRWDVLKEQGYEWWVERLRRNASLFDLVRLDHFRAFAAYWEVPAGAATARDGRWVEGPGADLFETLRTKLGSLPFVAEDLGDIDEAVLELRDRFGLPGMKVLQFAFGDDMPASLHIPHNYTQRFIAYTGTHDNNTSLGWFRTECDDATRRRVSEYLGHKLQETDLPPLLCRLALSSVAETAIIPVQDLLGLDELARMNKPASAEGNWGWRLLPGQLNKEVRRQLRQWTESYNRG